MLSVQGTWEGVGNVQQCRREKVSTIAGSDTGFNCPQLAFGCNPAQHQTGLSASDKFKLSFQHETASLPPRLISTYASDPPRPFVVPMPDHPNLPGIPWYAGTVLARLSHTVHHGRGSSEKTTISNMVGRRL